MLIDRYPAVNLFEQVNPSTGEHRDGTTSGSWTGSRRRS